MGTYRIAQRTLVNALNGKENTKKGVSPSPRSLCSPHDRPTNRRQGVEARSITLFRELADGEDGRLMSQNNHLIGVWMPGSFIDQRERSSEKLKSKGRIEREMQWGSKVKGSSVL